MRLILVLVAVAATMVILGGSDAVDNDYGVRNNMGGLGIGRSDGVGVRSVDYAVSVRAGDSWDGASGLVDVAGAIVTPTATPTPVESAVVAAGEPLPPESVTVPDVGTLEAIICSYTDWDCAQAVHVAACESGRNSQGLLDGWAAVNMWTATADPYDGVFGLFQLALPLHADLLAQYGAWNDPVANTAAAHKLWLDSGMSWYPHWAAACRP